MKSHFAHHGIPELLTSDNGPQYASEEFRKFAGAYSFQHVTSSPLYPQFNGAAERAVQTIKSIMKKEDDPYLGLLAYRSSPIGNGVSPGELLMGRKLRSTVPAHTNVLQPKLPKVERGSSVVECRTRNRVSPGSNPPLLPFRRLGIFVLSIVVPVDSAV